MKYSFFAAALWLTASSVSAHAHENGRVGPHAADHAPIGVMADHRHKQGEVMVSYRYMHMDMSGNRIGTNSVTPETIATTIPNRFFGTPMQPPTLRVVPTDMTMNMHMVGAMYGLSDRITLMGMTSFLSSDMDHTTFRGGMGNTVLGAFNTSSSGMGDSTLAAIIGMDDGRNKDREINVTLGLTVPTGATDKTDRVLTPMNMRPELRLPYPMQTGTGTWDLKPGVTLRQRYGQTVWGAQASARLPLGKNDDGYKRGNRVEGTAWVAWEPQYWLSLSGRLKAVSQGKIDGIDPKVVAPVQTANPDFQGGETVELLFGVNLAGQEGALNGHRLAFEVGVPLYRDLNGPQMETDLTVTAGWQKAF